MSQHAAEVSLTNSNPAFAKSPLVSAPQESTVDTKEKNEEIRIDSPEDSVNVSDEKPFEPPDGGLWAWLCVFGSFLLQFSSFGYVNA